MKIAKLSAPLLLTRCEELLRKYIVVQGRADIADTKCDEPSGEIQKEIVFVLEQLERLNLHPDISRLMYPREISGRIEPLSTSVNVLFPGNIDNGDPFEGDRWVIWKFQRIPSLANLLSTGSSRLKNILPGTDNRGHLLRLYPVFCECILIRDEGAIFNVYAVCTEQYL